MPEELWMEVCDIVQETGIKTIPKKKKCKKAKWLSEEALEIAVKRREVKSKEEKGRYTHLNAEFQRKARRDKKAFLSDQCKEIEINEMLLCLGRLNHDSSNIQVSYIANCKKQGAILGEEKKNSEGCLFPYPI